MNARTVLLLLLAGFVTATVVAAPNLEALRQGASAGEPWAQLNLGAAYDHGQSGLSPNATEAVYWYRLAAEQGIAEAQFNLAHCLATGHGIDQDYLQARIWMRLAAEQKLADAQFLLGVMLDQGLGGKADPGDAANWLSRASAQGNEQALQYIKNN